MLRVFRWRRETFGSSDIDGFPPAGVFPVGSEGLFNGRWRRGKRRRLLNIFPSAARTLNLAL